MNFFDAYPYVLLIDFLRYVLAAGMAYLLFWKFFKKTVKHRIIQRRSIKSSQVLYEIKYSISTIIVFSIIGCSILMAKQSGYTLIYEDISEKGWLWFSLSIVLMILIHDTWFYWTHRLMHHPRIFKHVHLVHHRSTSPTPWAAYSFHPIEAIIEAGIFPIIVFIIPAHETALLIFLIYMILRNVQGHLGMELLPKSFIDNRYLNWHTTTVHHDMHHRYFNSNYGLYFTWWDKWLKTEHGKYVETFEKITHSKDTN